MFQLDLQACHQNPAYACIKCCPAQDMQALSATGCKCSAILLSWEVEMASDFNSKGSNTLCTLLVLKSSNIQNKNDQQQANQRCQSATALLRTEPPIMRQSKLDLTWFRSFGMSCQQELCSGFSGLVAFQCNSEALLPMIH